MVGFDFNSSINFGQYTFTDSLKGLANARWTNCFFTTDGLSSQKTIRQMRPPISRQLSNKDLFLFRSIPVHGFCPDNISSESSRHRDLPASDEAKALSLWHPSKCITQYFSKCKRASGLENLCRLCPGANRQGTKALRQPRFRYPAKTHRLCSRFDHRRFVSVTFSMGKVSQAQSRSQAPYVNGPERLYTLFYPHYRRKSTRCKYPERTGFTVGRDLHHGSRLPRPRSSLYLHSKPFNFYYKSQKQFGLLPSLPSKGRENHRFAMRPDNKAQRFLCIAGLSCRALPSRLLRPRDKQKVRVPNKQLFATSSDSGSTVRVPLADRNLLQMDQAVLENQNIFRHHRERDEDSNLDCYQHLCLGGDCQERAENRTEFERNPADSQHYAFRSSADRTSTYKKHVAKSKSWVS
jgi:hypothetical protein